VVAFHSLRGSVLAYRVVATAIVLALAVAIHVRLATGRRDGQVTSRYAAIAECGAREFPAGTAFAADYWIARPLEMYSGGRLRGLPVVPGLQAFSNAGKVATLRRLRPVFVATGQSLTRSEFVRLFGEPDRTLCAEEGLAAGGIELLDYSRNERFKATLAAKAAAVY
jgi:hypothetical protein